MPTCTDCGYETGHNLRPMCPRQKDLDGIASRVGELTAINDWIARAVYRLRDEGETWEEIAAALGTSRQAAHKRFGLGTIDRVRADGSYVDHRTSRHVNQPSVS